MIKRIEQMAGLPWTTLFVLASLGVPRVVAHDLGLVDPHGAVNRLLVGLPIAVWLIYVVWKNVKRPFLAWFSIGLLYGILLAVVHQLLWNFVFEAPIQLGGNLSHLSGAMGTLIARAFAFISSVTTGAVMGIIVGVVGSIVHYVVNGIIRKW
ncbi:hypothetical protein [Paenibacillus senegalensis]|uniref:hypothetical protein n=1 Tax=Paenibacillus senegalensis TaxID=1465766 RepID=UPI000289FD8E|nr:hypothetical protein [Paenibacillus senegalensis]